MKNVLFKYCCESALVIYALMFLVMKHPQQEWDRVINSDGKAYYAYLTGIFIYQDLRYNFVEAYEAAYYPDDRSAFKEFRVAVGDRVVNKAFPGQALLWLPFFLLAHGITLMTSFPADGYSVIYQFMIGLSALFYLWLGCRMLRKLLHRWGAKDTTSAFITIVMVLGTNLLYYTLNEGSMTHTYSFAVITSLFYFLTLILKERDVRWLPLAGVLFGLTVIIRPVNGLLLLTIPFWAGSWENLTGFFKGIRTRMKLVFMTVLFTLAVLAIPVILWYIQTGNPFVYSYGDEYFDFTQPRIGKLLWSYEKGWFVYTPVALLSFFGLLPMARRHRSGMIFLLFFWIVFIYTSSSWWVWDYTSRFSQRIFIDFLGINGVMLYFLMDSLRVNRVFRQFAAAGILLLVILNVFQYYQCWKWVYPDGPVTRATYWKYFFQTRSMATVSLPPEVDILSRRPFGHDMEQDIGWLNPQSYVDAEARSGILSSRTGGGDTIGTGIDKLISPLVSSDRAMVVISCWVYASSGKARPSLIVDLLTDNVSYYYRVFSLKPYLNRGDWTFMQFTTHIPELQKETDRIKVYTANNSSTYPVFIDDMHIEFISLKSSPGPVPAIVNIPEEAKVYSRVFYFTMETDSIQLGRESLYDGFALEGKRSSKICQNHPYSIGLKETLRSVIPTGDAEILAGAFIHTDADTSGIFLVADFSNAKQTFFYSALSMAPFLEKKKWTYTEFLIKVPEVIGDSDEVLIYFWNPSPVEVTYIDNLEIEFFSTGKVAEDDQIRIDARDILSKKEIVHNMEAKRGWSNEVTLTDERALFGRQSCRISPGQPFSVAFQSPVDSLFSGHGKIRVSAFVLTDARNSAVSLVTDFRRAGKSYSYVPYYMNERTRYLEWEYVEYTIALPADREPGDELFVYFWNSSGQEVFYIDNIKIDFITLRN